MKKVSFSAWAEAITTRLWQPNEEENSYAVSDVNRVPYLIDDVRQFKGVGVMGPRDFSDADAHSMAISNAMTAKGVPSLDFNIIGEFAKAVDNWLIEGKPVKPVPPNVILQYGNSFRSLAVLIPALRAQSRFENASLPPIIATLYNLLYLNEFLDCVKHTSHRRQEHLRNDLNRIINLNSELRTEAYTEQLAETAAEISKVEDKFVNDLAPNRILGCRRLPLRHHHRVIS